MDTSSSASLHVLVESKIDDDEIDRLCEISEFGLPIKLSLEYFLELNFWPICGNGSVYFESRDDSGRFVIAAQNIITVSRYGL